MHGTQTCGAPDWACVLTVSDSPPSLRGQLLPESIKAKSYVAVASVASNDCESRIMGAILVTIRRKLAKPMKANEARRTH